MTLEKAMYPSISVVPVVVSVDNVHNCNDPTNTKIEMMKYIPAELSWSCCRATLNPESTCKKKLLFSYMIDTLARK